MRSRQQVGVRLAAPGTRHSPTCRLASSLKETPKTTTTAHAHSSSGAMKRVITVLLGSSFLPLIWGARERREGWGCESAGVQQGAGPLGVRRASPAGRQGCITGAGGLNA